MRFFLPLVGLTAAFLSSTVSALAVDAGWPAAINGSLEVASQSLELESRALGINCRGSFSCGGTSGNLDKVIYALNVMIAKGYANRHYAQGQQIACSSNICAFFQNLPGGENVQVAANKAQDLKNHGCKICGSCPTKPGNDVSTGELTVNYVSNPCCSGDSCYCL